MALRQIFDPADPVQIRDMNEMFRELYTMKLTLSGGTLTGGLNVGGHDLKNHVAITASNGNAYDTYPAGFSYGVITSDNLNQSAGPGFPSYGMVVTCNYNPARFEQILTAHSSNRR